MESSLAHRFVDVNGVRLHIAEQGQGPLVLLLHGWPESWYSWRHGHWTQQERPAEVNAALLDFLTGIDGTASMTTQPR
jgi:pimeloyl-ACP methyl ester carboxylesterase